MHWNNTQAIQKMDKLMGHTYNLKNINESQTQKGIKPTISLIVKMENNNPKM